MGTQELETLNSIYALLEKQKETNLKLCELLKLMLGSEEQPKQEATKELDTLREFIKEQLNAYDMPNGEDFINGIYRYVKRGNLSKDQIAEQLEKIFLANKKEEKQDLQKYTYGCFNKLTSKGE